VDIAPALLHGVATGTPSVSREYGLPAQREPPDGFDYDVVVIGSGFGGSVTALRLTEKGYRVGVLEAGQRFGPHNLPSNSWALRNFLWAPKLGLKGMQRLHLLKNVVILAGAGVGGGSLNYANTLYEPACRSSPIRSGLTSPTGTPSWRRSTPRPSGCWASFPIRR